MHLKFFGHCIPSMISWILVLSSSLNFIGLVTRKNYYLRKGGVADFKRLRYVFDMGRYTARSPNAESSYGARGSLTFCPVSIERSIARHISCDLYAS